jgi:hypothetical protein
MYRSSGGKIQACGWNDDLLGLLPQLGAIPT